MKFDKLTVIVATHKSYQMPQDPCYLPLHVGKALHPESDLGYQPDNTGDNISSENRKYSELTGLYWLWKNCNSAYKGLSHYRRHFGTRTLKRRWVRNRFERIATTADFLAALRTSDVVVPRKRNYVIETVRNHYGLTFSYEELDTLRQVLAAKYPEYLTAFENQMNSRKAHIFNMFVMPADLFDKYCEWLFDILNAVDEIHDTSGYTQFQLRYLGRLSERLLDVWLITNGLSVSELPIVSPEPVRWSKKIMGVLLAKFFGKKYTQSF